MWEVVNVMTNMDQGLDDQEIHQEDAYRMKTDHFYGELLVE